MQITGHGRYKTKGLAKGIGGALGTAVGGPLGGLLGTAGGALIDHVFGSGDYKITENTLAGAAPVFGDGSANIRVRHAEYLGDVVSSAAYAATMYRINPGDPVTFPWLRQVAVNYQQYKLRGMLVEFKTTSATAVASTNTALGIVGIATNYNVDEAVFSSKRVAESSLFCSSAVPSASFVHAVECATPAQITEMRFVRVGTNIPGTASRALYDHANFTVFTQGAQAASVVGELWVTYDVEFFKPIIPDPLGEAALQAHAKGNSQTTPTSAPTSGNFFGPNTSAIIHATNNTIKLTFDTTNAVRWDAVGTFLVIYTARASTSWTAGASGVLIGYNGITTATPVLVNFWGVGSYGGVYISPNAGSGTQSYVNACVVQCTLPGQGVGVATYPTVVGTADWDIVVLQISADLISSVGSMLDSVFKVGRGVVFNDDKKCQAICDLEAEEALLRTEEAECKRIMTVMRSLAFHDTGHDCKEADIKANWIPVARAVSRL